VILSEDFFGFLDGDFPRVFCHGFLHDVSGRAEQYLGIHRIIAVVKNPTAVAGG
jgi:hypothetical protein